MHCARATRIMIAAGALLLAAILSAEAEEPAFGPELQGFDYPWPVHDYSFTSQGEAVAMGYMDVPATTPNGKTAVVLHGKNFCAATWEHTITALADAGYRVIAPDQIGFCKSTKPEHYQYSFQQLAANTHALLAALGIAGPPSSGIPPAAARHPLCADVPGRGGELALVDPIGLEDWKAMGVRRDASISGIGANDGHRRRHSRLCAGTYYAGRGRPQFDRWVDMLAGMYQAPGETSWRGIRRSSTT